MTDAQAPLTLKPCPFCGGTAHFDIDDDNWEWVECSNCGMQGNRSASLMEDCKPNLADAWNRRAQPTAQEGGGVHQQLEDLQAKVERIGLDIDSAMRGKVNEQSPVAGRLRNIAAAQARIHAPATKDCTRPECMSLGCFGHCMKGIRQEKQR